jgi:Ca2+-binding EF-hand superfamily protein
MIEHLSKKEENFLRPDGLKKALRALGMDPSDEELLEVMYELEPKSPVHASKEDVTSIKGTEIYFEEFCLYYHRLYESHLASKLDRKMIKKLFSEADLDYNGYLDKAEFKAVIRRLCPMLTELNLDNIFQMVDSINKDGRIEYSEFEAFLKTNSPTSN